jgi:hypothetical protein
MVDFAMRFETCQQEKLSVGFEASREQLKAKVCNLEHAVVGGGSAFYQRVECLRRSWLTALQVAVISAVTWQHHAVLFEHQERLTLSWRKVKWIVC